MQEDKNITNIIQTINMSVINNKHVMVRICKRWEYFEYNTK